MQPEHHTSDIKHLENLKPNKLCSKASKHDLQRRSRKIDQGPEVPTLQKRVCPDC